MNFKPFDSEVFVTKPTLPDLASYTDILGQIWESGWLTNNGAQVKTLEQALRDYLGVSNLSAVGNGTLALMLALKALGLRKGSVVTTPFTFPATVNVLDWLGLTPIFADIDPATGNIDPKSVADRIQPDTVAVLAVHVFGTPCDHQALSAVCANRQLPIVYDAAHAFGVKVDGLPLLEWGTASTLSFHATKLFSTVEGGAVVARDPALSADVGSLRNFGILNEETVVLTGINAKMNELQAAYGLLRLDHVEEEIANRGRIAQIYDEVLGVVEGVMPVPQRDGSSAYLESIGFKKNHSYYPVRVVENQFGQSRDELKRALEAYNVKTRKYFYPLCSRIPAFRDLDTAHPAMLPVAHRFEQEVLCLPIYGELPCSVAQTIAEMVASQHRL